MGIDVEDDEGLGLGGQHDGLPITPELNLVRQVLAGSDEKVPKTHQGVVELVEGGGQEEVGGAVAELVEVEGDLLRSGQAGEGEDGRRVGRVEESMRHDYFNPAARALQGEPRGQSHQAGPPCSSCSLFLAVRPVVSPSRPPRCPNTPACT